MLEVMGMQRLHALAASPVLLAWALACSPGESPSPENDSTALEPWQRARQVDYLAFACDEALDPASQSQVLIHLTCEARMDDFELPAGAVPDDAWDPIFDKMSRLRDTSDFNALRFLALVYAYDGHPAISESLWGRIEASLLSFKYWFSDPTPARVVDGAEVVDGMWYWTENHELVFRTAEYLAGQRYPEAVFEVTGLSGAEHRDRAREALLTWLDHRARWGFAEWHSDVYYDLDLQPLLMLVEWADDEELSTRAAMVLDLLWLDIALHLQRGNSGATHGRSYIKDKGAAPLNDIFDGNKLLFEDTELPWSSPISQLAGLLSLTTTYSLPWVIREIAADGEPMVDRERMNLPIDERPPEDWDSPIEPAPYGLTYGEADLPQWWAMNAYSTWPLFPLTFEVAGREGLWENQLSSLAVLTELVDVNQAPEAIMEDLHPIYEAFWQVLNVVLLKEVSTTTYRTDAVMLSSAQDYRKGLIANQIHPWQATLDETAIVFTQQPAFLPVADGEPIPTDFSWREVDEPGPGYWTGEGSLPRIGQTDNVAVILYAPHYPAMPLGIEAYNYLDETHAYFPQAHFDEVVQEGGWTFGRKGDGYVGLYSHNPTTWRTGQPEVYENGDLPFDLVAAGTENAWIVEVGDATTWADFAAFRAALVAAQLVITPLADQGSDGFDDGFEVAYTSPSRGLVEFSWEAPLEVDGVEIPLRHEARFDNPFVSAPFDARRYEVTRGEATLTLDFDSAERSATPAPAAE